MLESLQLGEELSLQELTPEEKTSRGILGRLSGPIASFVKATRNGRKYSSKLWDNAFQGDIVKEMFANGGLVGQLEHPVGTSESDPMKACILMREPPVKDHNGHLIANVDILNTPCGQIAYALSKAGFKFGISSRGEGDLIEGIDGEEVDPDTYELITFDLVALPACEDARLTFSESLEKPFDYKKSLRESMEKATDEDKAIMQETLNTLGIDLNEKSTAKADDIKEAVQPKNSVVNNEDRLVEELQKVLQENRNLENIITGLNEKLSDCYAKETKQGEINGKLSQAVEKLSESSRREKALQTQLLETREELKTKTGEVKELNNTVTSLKESLTESETNASKVKALLDKYKSNSTVLKESLSKNTGSVQSLTEKLEKSQSTISAKNAEIKKLTENYEKLQKNQKQQVEGLNKKIEEKTELIEKYKKTTVKTVNKYIESVAAGIGVTAETVKQKLPENYSLKDIDDAVESLKSYKLNISKLPFSTQMNESMKAGVKNAYRNVQLTPNKPRVLTDDDIDNSLLALAKLR